MSKPKWLVKAFPRLPGFLWGNRLICPKFQVHDASGCHRWYFLTINIKLNFMLRISPASGHLHTACRQHTALLPDGNRGFCSTENYMGKARLCSKDTILTPPKWSKWVTIHVLWIIPVFQNMKAAVGRPECRQTCHVPGPRFMCTRRPGPHRTKREKAFIQQVSVWRCCLSKLAGRVSVTSYNWGEKGRVPYIFLFQSVASWLPSKPCWAEQIGSIITYNNGSGQVTLSRHRAAPLWELPYANGTDGVH